MSRATTLKSRLMLTHLLMAISIMLVLMATSAVWVWEPLLRSATQDFAIIIADDVESLRDLHGQERAQFSQLMARRHGLEVLSGAPEIRDPAPLLPYLRALAQSIEAKLGQKVRIVATAHSTVDYAFRTSEGDHTLWLGFAHERIGTAPILSLIVMFSLTTLVAAFAAHTLTHWLTRPLLALQRGAHRLTEGQEAKIPADSGVRELDDLAHSYNTLAAEVRRLIEQRTTILAGIAHDLRTPLTRMGLALALAREKSDVSRLERIEQYSAEMRDLIDSYLDFAAGSTQRPLEPVAIDTCLSALTENRGAHFIAVLEAGCVSLNRQAFERIINNLLDNAVKHGRPPLMLRSRYPEHRLLRVEIENAGDLLTEKQCSEAFEPFIRLDAARDPSRQGSGLGLAIVREIATANGWRVGLIPRAAGGVIAWLEIPLPTRAMFLPDPPDQADTNPAKSA